MDTKNKELFQLFDKLVELPETQFDEVVDAARYYQKQWGRLSEQQGTISDSDQMILDQKTEEIYHFIKGMLGEEETGAEDKIINLSDKIFNRLMKKGNQEIRYGNYEVARAFYHRALETAENADIRCEQFLARCALGTILRDECKFSEAEKYFHALLKDRKLSDPNRIHCLYELTICAKFLGNYSIGLRHAQEGYELARKQSEKQLMAKIVNAAGTIHDVIGDFEMALNCYHDSIKIIEDLNDLWLYGIVTGNCALTYINMKDYKNGLELTDKARRMAEEIGNKRIVAEQIDNSCDAYIKIGDIDQLRENAARLIEYARENKFHQLLYNGYCYLGRSYVLEDKNNKALEAFNKASTLQKTFHLEGVG